MKSKGLTIGLVVLAVVAALVFFLPKIATGPQQKTEITPVVAEQKAAEEPKAGEETAVAPAPVPAPAPAAASNALAPATDQSLLEAPVALAVDVAALMKDRVLGDENAPVTIVEYASLTCSHCANFATVVLPEVKKQLIDTGKAKLIFRDFPLDKFALKASMMARCVSGDKYFNLLEVLFSNQERWAHAKDPLEALAQLGSLAGIDADLFKACTENPALETALLNNIQDAQGKYQITSTPTFIFNDGAEKISGSHDVSQFVEAVNKLTKGK